MMAASRKSNPPGGDQGDSTVLMPRLAAELEDWNLPDTVTDEAATVEVERVDEAELSAGFPKSSQAQDLAKLKGPLDLKTSRNEALPEDAEPSERGLPEGRRPRAAKPRRVGRRWYRSSLVWLVPLGVCSLGTLGYALWLVLLSR